MLKKQDGIYIYLSHSHLCGSHLQWKKIRRNEKLAIRAIIFLFFLGGKILLIALTQFQKKITNELNMLINKIVTLPFYWRKFLLQQETVKIIYKKSSCRFNRKFCEYFTIVHYYVMCFMFTSFFPSNATGFFFMYFFNKEAAYIVNQRERWKHCRVQKLWKFFRNFSIRFLMKIFYFVFCL